MLRPPPQELTKPKELVLPLSPLSPGPSALETPLKVAALIPVQEEGEVGMMWGKDSECHVTQPLPQPIPKNQPC